MSGEMNKIRIGSFIFEADIKNTKNSHNQRIASSLECNCGDCKEFNKNREKIFTNKLKKLLKKFGLNYKKEDYLTTYGEDLQEVNYYVKGRIIKQLRSSLNLSSLIEIDFVDKDLPTNFLPEDLSQPYFLIRVWIKK